MPILEIDGGLRVEVDDTFLSLPPAAQDAVIADIVSANMPQPKAAPRPKAPQAPKAPLPEDAPVSTITDPAEVAFDNASVARMPQADGFIVSDDWLAQQEADYQASLAERGYPVASPSSKSTPPAADKTTGIEAGVLGAVDGLTFGFGDELDAAIGSVLGGEGYKTVWDGDGFSSAFNSNVSRNRELLADAQHEHPLAYIGGGVAGGILPITGAVGGAAKAATALGKLKSATKTGAAYGAAYGAGSATGNPLDRLDDVAIGAGIGAAGGAGLHLAAKGGSAALSPLARKVLPKLSEAQFAKEQALNPHLLTDANVADDLDKLVQTMMVDGAKRKLSASQRSALVSRIDDLEASYLPREEVKALDLPPSVKARLNTAMAKRHLLSQDELQSLRDGTPAGEAVADGIEKARRLRAYVAETSGSRTAGGSFLGEALGSAVGWKAAGPIGGALGGRIGRAAMRSEGQAAKEALALADKAPKFAKLPEVQAVKEANGSGDSLARMSALALDKKYLASKAAETEAARLEAEGRKVATANARDNIVPSGGWRGLIYERTGLRPAEQDAGALAALNDGAISPEQFDAYLTDPAVLMRGNAGNSLIDRLAAYADSGRVNRDPKWSPRPMLSREADLMRELDEIDPVRGSLADGVPLRDSEAGMLDSRPADLERAHAIRSELSRLRSEGAGVRNPIAYKATAEANQQRVTDALSTVQSRSDLPDIERENLASAVAAIGNTSSRETAERIIAETVERMGENNRASARTFLAPLAQQIRR